MDTSGNSRYSLTDLIAGAIQGYTNVEIAKTTATSNVSAAASPTTVAGVPAAGGSMFGFSPSTVLIIGAVVVIGLLFARHG